MRNAKCKMKSLHPRNLYRVGRGKNRRFNCYWLRLCCAGLLAPFCGYFIVFHPADSSVTVDVAAGRIDRDDTSKRLRKVLHKDKR